MDNNEQTRKAITDTIEKYPETIMGQKIRCQYNSCKNNTKAVRKLYEELVSMGIISNV